MGRLQRCHGDGGSLGRLQRCYGSGDSLGRLQSCHDGVLFGQAANVSRWVCAVWAVSVTTRFPDPGA